MCLVGNITFRKVRNMFTICVSTSVYYTSEPSSRILNSHHQGQGLIPGQATKGLTLSADPLPGLKGEKIKRDAKIKYEPEQGASNKNKNKLTLLSYIFKML